MSSHTTRSGQNLLDVALQTQGDLSGFVLLCEANGLALDAVLLPGQTLALAEVVDPEVVDYYAEVRANYQVSTGEVYTEPSSGPSAFTNGFDNGFE